MTQDVYDSTAADGYERAFARISSHFVPFLLASGRVAPGQAVLDVATGTGLAAAAALATVGPAGHVTAVDLSPHMVEQARKRLGDAGNVSLGVEDGQALGFPDASFDTVLCSLGLMFFPDPVRGLAEFHRVLRAGGRAAVSVNTIPARSWNTRVHVVIARHAPSHTAAATRLFSLGDEARLRGLFEAAGFSEVEVATESQHFPMPSFDAYFDHVERGWGSPGQAFVSLPKDLQRVVREEVRRDLGDTGGPIAIEVEYRFASGRK